MPIDVPNVDTDQIIPARFLLAQTRRRLRGISCSTTCASTTSGDAKPDFVLNQPAYRDARILVADRNFGCGSSRESAVWALYDYGVRAVHRAELRRHLLQQLLQERPAAGACCRPNGSRRCARCCSSSRRARTSASTSPAQTVTGPDGRIDAFDIDPFRKECLLAGTDDIAFTLRHGGEIAAFEQAYDATVPWMRIEATQT